MLSEVDSIVFEVDLHNGCMVVNRTTKEKFVLIWGDNGCASNHLIEIKVILRLGKSGWSGFCVAL